MTHLACLLAFERLVDPCTSRVSADTLHGIRIMSSQSNRSDNDGSKRRTTRSISPLLSPLAGRRILDNDVNEDGAPKRRRTSARNVEYCVDINGLPANLYCDGCSRYEDSTKRKPRHLTKSREMQCSKLWKLAGKDVPEIKRSHWNAINDHINNVLHWDADRLRDESTTTTETATATTTTTPAVNSATPSPDEAKKPRNINMIKQTISCEGKKFNYSIPSTHKIMHRSQIKALENDRDKLQQIRDKMQKSRYETDSIMAQSLWAITMAAVPALALSAAQFLAPLIVQAFFHDTGLFDYKKFDPNLYATSFPSDWYLRKCQHHQATRDTMLLGHELRNKKIYMSADKGNKKGIGHLVKILSWWKHERMDIPIVSTRLLDIDAAGGTDKECAAGIGSSMNKLKAHDEDDTHLLDGNTTDSGGGGTLDNLADELLLIEHVREEEDYLVAACSLHALQLQLSNAVRETFGEGALDKINAMQLIHSVYRLQESIDMDEWRHVLYLSLIHI